MLFSKKNIKQIKLFFRNLNYEIPSRILAVVLATAFLLYAFWVLFPDNKSLTKNYPVIQGKVVLGQPVKWVQILPVDQIKKNLDKVLEIPNTAKRGSIIKGKELADVYDKNSLFPQLAIDDRKTLLNSVVAMHKNEPKTANKILMANLADTKDYIVNFFTDLLKHPIYTLKGKTAIDLGKEIKDINQDKKYIAVEYYTPAPISKETNTNNGKEISIFAEDDLHYKEITAFTNVPELYTIEQLKGMQIFWKEKNTYVHFDAYDLNNNGLVDYVEWQVPHLSNQTYEIIYISKALKLDSQENIIGDIYETLKDRDEKWELLKDGEFIKTTFKIPLQRKNDISIYAKADSPAKVEVYTENNVLLATFENIQQEKKYTIFLSKLKSPTQTFYLKILGDVQINQIVDPASSCSGTPTDAYACSPLNGNLTTCNLLTGTCMGSNDNFSCIQIGGAPGPYTCADFNTDQTACVAVGCTADSTPPATTAEADNSYIFGTVTGNMLINVTLTCSDGDGGGCAGIYTCTDGDNTCTPTTLYSNPIGITGTSYIRYYSVDNAGNEEPVTYSIVKISLDTTTPSISYSGATPADSSSQLETSATVATTSSDTDPFNSPNLEHSITTNFDNSLLGWWTMDGQGQNVNDYLNVNGGTKHGASINQVPVMTANTGSGGVASASTILDNASDAQPYLAFNHAVGLWHSAVGDITGPSDGAWLQYQFPEPKVITSYTITQGGNEKPKDWTLNGSNNGTDWNVLDTRTNITNWDNPNSYTISTPVGYIFYRLDITAVGNAQSYCQVGELELFAEGPTQTDSGKYGKGMSFDGTGYIETTNNIDISGNADRTLAAWIYKEPGTGNYEIMDFGTKSNNHFSGFGVDGNDCTNCLIFTGYNNDVISTGTINVNEWNHVAVTYNGSNNNVKIYINGVLDTSSTSSAMDTTADTTLKIGKGADDWQNWDGQIDDVQVYNRVLNADEVASLYSGGTAQYSNTFTGLAVGDHTFKSYAQDLAGNITAESLRTFTVTAPAADTTPPSIAYNFGVPTNGSTQSENSATVATTTSDNNGEHSVVNDFDNSLVGWWRFTSAIDPNTDYSSFGNNAQSNGATWTADGKLGGAYSFNGTSSNLSMGSSVDVVGDISVSAWVNPTSIGSNPVQNAIVGKGGGWNRAGFLLTATDNIFRWHLGNGSGETYINSTTTISPNTWTHVVATCQDGTMKIYINGVEDASTGSFPGCAVSASSSTELIGATDGDSPFYFSGLIDDVQIYKRALSQGEISALYNANTTPYSKTFENLANGDHTFKAYAQDTAGNVANESLRTFTVNSTPSCAGVSNCSSHGTCTGPDTCTCYEDGTNGYWNGDTSCSSCSTNYYPTGTCNVFCQASTTCSGNGTCDANGSCVCVEGWTGADCNTPNYDCSSVNNCSGHGTCTGTNICTCTGNWSGGSCNGCVTGWTGANCDECATNYYPTGTCNVLCEASTTCSGHGTCSAQGACECSLGWTGSTCNTCATNYYPTGTCNVFCNPATTCNGHGTCSAQGACTCGSNYYSSGSGCDSFDATPPSVNAGPDQIEEGVFTQSSTVTDGGSGVATYLWEQISGPDAIIFGSPTASSTSILLSSYGSSDGNYVIRLTATDYAGNSQSDTFNLTWDTTPPSVNLGSNLVKKSEFTQTVTASDSGSGIASYYWEQTSGPGQINFGSNTSNSTTISADQNGDYTIMITVTDNLGNSNYDELNLTWDATPPTLSEISAVSTPSTQTSQSYTFNSTEIGTISYTGSCSSDTGAAVVGNNTITFTNLSVGTHGDCIITVIDGAGNISDELHVTSFTITASTPPAPEPTPEPIVSGGMSDNNNGWIQNLASTISTPAKVVAKATEDTAKQIIDTVTQEKDIALNLPPVEQVVTQETPDSLNKKWDIVNPAPMYKLSLSPLPASLLELTRKFPSFAVTLEQAGITKPSDVSKLQVSSLNLPTIAQIINIPQGKPLLAMTSIEKAMIPTEIVFVKTGNELIDFDVKVSIDETGSTRQTIKTISGKPIQLIIKPDGKVNSIKGYISYISKKPEVNSQQSKKFAAALLSAAQKQAEIINNTLAVKEFEYQDPDKDGIYTAEFSAPLTDGQYDIVSTINYADKKLGSKEIKMTTIVDPEGYIYQNLGNQEVRINNAEVSIYWLNPETKTYELWPAKNYKQENPQITDKKGTYTFLVPEGYYYIKVVSTSYVTYRTKPFEVKEGSGIHENIELQSKYWWMRTANWEIILLVITVLLLGANFFKDRFLELVESRKNYAKNNSNPINALKQ